MRLFAIAQSDSIEGFINYAKFSSVNFIKESGELLWKMKWKINWFTQAFGSD